MANQWKLIVRNSILEILGEKQAAELHNFQNSLNPDIEEIHLKLGDMLGKVSAIGIEQRIGQAGFRYFLAQLGSELGFFLPTLKLLPTRQKTIKGFGILSDFYRRVNNEEVEFTETGADYQLKMQKEADNDTKQYFGCHFLIGFIQEYMAWVGNGKFFLVFESECRSNGYINCIYNISKIPFD
jgi:hypothetical protein